MDIKKSYKVLIVLSILFSISLGLKHLESDSF